VLELSDGAWARGRQERLELQPDFVKIAYAKGAPMGSDLKPGSGKAPTLLVMALKDARSGNLDRIQIIKGWLDAAGKQHEKIYEVAWSGDRKIGPKGKLPPGRRAVSPH
jgi:hypothetical protein